MTRPKITEEPIETSIRQLARPGTWRRLSFLEKISVLQTGLALCSLCLLVVLVLWTVVMVR